MVPRLDRRHRDDGARRRGRRGEPGAIDPSPGSSPAVLPGEPWIAYAWDAQEVKVIRMVRPDGSDDHLAIGGAPAFTEHPDWSPDGTQIAYVVDWSSIWIANADGSDPIRIATCTTPCVDIDMPAWSPDGTQVAFRTLEITDGFYTGSAIEVVDIASGVTRTVVQARCTPVPPLATLVAGRTLDGGRARTLRLSAARGDRPRSHPRQPSRSSTCGKTQRPRRRSSRPGTSTRTTLTGTRPRT